MFTILLILTGCKGEDGEDGKVYVEGEWTSDINALDISSIIKGGINPPFFLQNTKYELEPGRSGYIYWRSDVTWYSSPVIIDDAQEGTEGSMDVMYFPLVGEDGKDTITRVRISGSNIYDLGTRYESSFVGSNQKISIPSESANSNEVIPGFLRKNR